MSLCLAAWRVGHACGWQGTSAGCPRVLLAGDHAVWDPGGGEAGAELWTHLRLLFCRAVWYYWYLQQSGPWPSVLCFCCGGSGFFLATTGYQA
jgi:hypothetical protein